MGVKSGHLGKVTLGASTIVGMGTWSISGITADQMESSAFDQDWKTYEFGMKDGGQISFNGFLDPADTTGQQALQKANMDNTDLTSLRLYVDNTSYYEPCQSTGYFAPGSLSTGQDTILSHVNITAYDISMDKAGLATISFTGKVSGVMVLI
jgi:hypothetical protein